MNVARKVDQACSKAEDDPERSASDIARRRAELCEQAMTQLANFKPFEVAERALCESIGSLERLDYRDPHQVQMLQTLTQARKELREGIESTKRLVQERCRVRDRVFV